MYLDDENVSELKQCISGDINDSHFNKTDSSNVIELSDICDGCSMKSKTISNSFNGFICSDTNGTQYITCKLPVNFGVTSGMVRN